MLITVEVSINLLVIVARQHSKRILRAHGKRRKGGNTEADAKHGLN
jgi:hypothetical protein